MGSFPLPCELQLEILSGLKELVRSFSVSNIKSCPTAVSTIFVQANLAAKGREGIVLGLGFVWGADLASSPVTLNEVRGSTIGDVILGPYNAQMGSADTPAILPLIAGGRIPPGSDVGLVINNQDVSGAAFNATGCIHGVTWSEEHARRVREKVVRTLERNGLPWPSQLVE